MSIGVILALMLCCIFGTPAKAFADYKDGTYSVGVTCTGGSGRGGVRAASVTVSGGKIISAALTMSSANYDWAYDPVTGGKIYASTGSGASVFYINYPGQSFNFTADTTAMSDSHQITYTVSLNLSGIPSAQSGSSGGSGSGSGGSSQGGSSGQSAAEKAAAELKKKQQAADKLIEDIGEVTIDSEEAIAAAREAVDAFSDAEKKGLTKLSVLEEAEKTLEAIKEKIASADALIESIGEVTLDSEEAIIAAREAVDSLSAKEKVRLTKLSVLSDAENTLEDLKIAAAEAAAKAAQRKRIITYSGIGVAALVVLAVCLILAKKKRKA